MDGILRRASAARLLSADSGSTPGRPGAATRSPPGNQ